MEKKTLRVEGPFVLNAFTLLSVSETTCLGEQVGGAVLFRVSKKPIAVVVISPAGKRAFRMTGEEISLEDLTVEVPDLSAEISRAIRDSQYDEKSKGLSDHSTSP